MRQRHFECTCFVLAFLSNIDVIRSGREPHVPKYAVVRPYATEAEAEELVRSHQSWASMEPCRADPAKAWTVDMFLVFSRDRADYPGVNAHIANAITALQAYRGVCLDNVSAVDVKLSAEQDRYDPKNRPSPGWVSGPNNVFRWLLRFFGRNGTGASYEAFFLMEVDNTPLRPYWFDYFRSLVRPEVAICGSFYRGHNWDFSRSTMDAWLLLHINGNAIYNVRHPLMRYLQLQLEADVGTDADNLAYDVRMSQIVWELRRDPCVWTQLVGNSSVEPYDGSSMLIGNYANTLLTTDGGEYIMHTARGNMMDTIAGTREVVLGVYKFNSMNFSTFWKSAKASSLPFADSFMTTQETKTTSTQQRLYFKDRQLSQDLVLEDLGTSPGSDETGPLCELAAMSSKYTYLLYTDTYHVIRTNTSFLKKKGTEQVVLPYVEGTSPYCMNDDHCVNDLVRAKTNIAFVLKQNGMDSGRVNSTMDGMPYRHYDTHETLYWVEPLQKLCKAWEAAFVIGGDWCPLTTGPSGNDYVTFMRANYSNFSDYYTEENKEVKGWQPWSILHTPHPENQCYPGYKRANVSVQTCAQFVVGEESACDANPDCEWLSSRGKCVHSLRAATAKAVRRLSEAPQRKLQTEEIQRHAALMESPYAEMDLRRSVMDYCSATSTARVTETSTTGTSVTGTSVTGTSVTRTSSGTSTSIGTNSTTLTVTTTTAPLMAVAASVLIPINVSRITEAHVADLLWELQVAAEEAKSGISQSNYVDAAGVRLEMTETSSIFLLKLPTKVQKAIYLESIRDVRCGVMTKDECDVQEVNATTGLKAEKGAAPQRRLQASSRYELLFEVFMIITQAAQMQNTVPLDDPTFHNQFIAVVVQKVSANAELSINESTYVSENTTVELIGYMTPPQVSALTVVELRAEETAPVDHNALQVELSNTMRIIAAVTQVSPLTVLGTPSVDLCLGRTCGGHGVCSAGLCACDTGWSPPNCLLPTMPSPTSTSEGRTSTTVAQVSTVAPRATVAPEIGTVSGVGLSAALAGVATLCSILGCFAILGFMFAVKKLRDSKKASETNNEKGDDGNVKDPDLREAALEDGLQPGVDLGELILPATVPVTEPWRAHRPAERPRARCTNVGRISWLWMDPTAHMACERKPSVARTPNRASAGCTRCLTQMLSQVFV